MSTDLVVTELAPSTLFGTDNHAEVVARASDLARTLEQVVRKQNLVVRIGQSEHVRVEGWMFLGSMLGVFPVVEWTRPVMLDDEQIGWEARVEARTRSGEIVGAAEAECLRSERTWKGRDDYALRSMAQTRAVSKALRLALGFVMQLAGFNPTPAEEMAVIDAERPYVDVAAGTPFSDDPDDPLDPPLEQILSSGSAGGPKATGTADASPVPQSDVLTATPPDALEPASPADTMPSEVLSPEAIPPSEGSPTFASVQQKKLIWALTQPLGANKDEREAVLRPIIREHTGQESSAAIPRDKVDAIKRALEIAAAAA